MALYLREKGQIKMQTKPIVAVLLIGAYLIQPSESTIEEVISGTSKVIQQATSTIVYEAAAAESALDNLLHKINLGVSGAIDSIKQQIKNIKDAAEKEINSLFRSTTRIDVSDCLSAAKDSLEQLPSQFAVNEVHCVTAEVDSARNIISETSQVINNTISGVTALTSQLQACRTDPNPTACLSSIASESMHSAATSASTIVQEVMKATTFVSGLQSRLEICVAAQVANAGMAAANIVATFTECATK